MTKIAIFFGGKISRHLVLIKKAARKMGVDLSLVSYNKVCFDTEKGKVLIRPNLASETKIEFFDNYVDVNTYDVLFFRTTGKHWEEANLIIDSVKREDIVIVDPLVRVGKSSMFNKAWQMLKLTEAGVEVPKTVYGSLWYFFEKMKSGFFKFPVIIKGSGGNRGTRVYKVDNLEEMEKLIRDLRKSETEDGRRYMLQEFVPNDGDYRVLVIGDKVLGAMKRSSQNKDEFKNNFSVGGKVEIASLPEEINELAIKAAKVCGLMIAGVDVAFRDNDFSKPVIWEVNKGPQFKGFMKATGINVPAEIVKFLVSLKK